MNNSDSADVFVLFLCGLKGCVFPVVHQQDLHNPSSPEDLRTAKPSLFPSVLLFVMLASGRDG